MRFIFITHPEVVIDAAIPVPEWPLSPLGRRRMEGLAQTLAGAGARAVWSSEERKARDGAEILAGRLALPHHVRAGLGENDRSATGFIAEPEFSAVAARFFASPDDSILGWETARDAQRRIVAAIHALAAEAEDGLHLVVSHGGVGRLLRAHLEQVPIGEESRPGHPGGGCCMAFSGPPFRPDSPWLDIEQWAGAPLRS